MDDATLYALNRDPFGTLEEIIKQYQWVANNPILAGLVRAMRTPRATDDHIIKLGWPCEVAREVNDLCTYRLDYIRAVADQIRHEGSELDRPRGSALAEEVWNKAFAPTCRPAEGMFIFGTSGESDPDPLRKRFPGVCLSWGTPMSPCGSLEKGYQHAGWPLFARELLWHSTAGEPTFTSFDGDGSAVLRTVSRVPTGIAACITPAQHCFNRKNGIHLVVGNGIGVHKTSPPVFHPFFRFSHEKPEFQMYGETVVHAPDHDFPEMWRIRFLSMHNVGTTYEKLCVVIRADLGPNIAKGKKPSEVQIGHGWISKTVVLNACSVVLDVGFTVFQDLHLEIENDHDDIAAITPKLVRTARRLAFSSGDVAAAMKPLCDNANNLIFQQAYGLSLHNLLGSHLITSPPKSLFDLFLRQER